MLELIYGGNLIALNFVSDFSCSTDFLDVYIDVASSSLDQRRHKAILDHIDSGEPATTTPFSAEVYSLVLDRSTVLGRFCGELNSTMDSPLEFISLHREIVLDYYSTGEGNSQGGFEGTFKFIRDGK